jgi:hypothetical protein
MHTNRMQFQIQVYHWRIISGWWNVDFHFLRLETEKGGGGRLNKISMKTTVVYVI